MQAPSRLMRQFSEMEWDWEKFGVYGSKAIESRDWGIIDDGECVNGISASTDSSITTKDGMGFSSLLGLKLGKRTYFETEMPPSTTTLKKTKSSAPPISCQVDGCNIDLSKAKQYHRKHRVCDTHSKCPRVIVGGRELRFCQQCSRFHSVSEFDEKKRSCRTRLSDHNARRRKPQHETIQFDPTRHATSYYGGNQEMNFVLNNNFTLTHGYSFKSNGGDGAKAPHQGTINMQNTANGLENSTSLVSNPGSKGSLICSVSAAPVFGRALSLLSSNSWEPESIPLHHHQSDMQPMEGVPSHLWLTGQHHSIHPHIPTNANFQETPSAAAAATANFYSNILH